MAGDGLRFSFHVTHIRTLLQLGCGQVIYWVRFTQHLNGFVKEPNMFHNYETEKITCKASDAAENLQLYRVVRFFHPRSSCTTTHLMFFSERPPMYASCVTILGGWTEQLDIIAGFLTRVLYVWFSSAENVRWYMRRALRSRMEELNNTL